MSQFHNPYHFVPLGPGEPPATVPLDDFKKPQEDRQTKHLTHDQFVPGKHSGRIVCKVTVETPTICGNAQEARPNAPKLLKPFELKAGEPALSASSLRGMISSLAEAASHSAMRVLENRVMSYRRELQEGLTAIGLVIEKDGELELFPLAGPHMKTQGGVEKPIPEGILADYAAMFPNPNPKYKVYFGSSASIATPSFLTSYKSNSNPTGGPFYAIHQGWLLPKIKQLGAVSVNLGSELVGPNQQNQIGDRAANVYAWDSLTEGEKSTRMWIRGILRVLGKYDRRKEALINKKHEFFLPFSPADESSLTTGAAASFPIETEAIQRFNQLADERAGSENDDTSNPEELLPFTPHGMSRQRPEEKNRPKSSWKLKAGDIVFFRPSAGGRTVSEISLSSAWRGRVETESPVLSTAAPVWSFLDPGLIPLTPERKFITLAEQLFGVVETRDNVQKETYKNQEAFALASRISISHGLLHSAPGEGAYQPVGELFPARLGLRDYPLKNLASPKLPSPAFYFKPKNSPAAYIPKSKLNPNSHTIQGRKFYLRRDKTGYEVRSEALVHVDRFPANANEENDTVKTIRKQHQAVEKFIRKDSTFYFHLDFNNLSALELQLLAYVLRPTSEFRHQIGHGKPLGLGQIMIEIEGLLEVNRQTRYSKSLSTPRWETVWAVGNSTDDWPQSLRRDLSQDQTINPLETKVMELRRDFIKWASENGLASVLQVLELSGKPLPADAKVHHPQPKSVNNGTRQNPQLVDVNPGTPQFEERHFNWFVQNDKGRPELRDHNNNVIQVKAAPPKQFLMPLFREPNEVARSIPKLTRDPVDPVPNTPFDAPPVPRDLANQIVNACVVQSHAERRNVLRIIFQVPCGATPLTGVLGNAGRILNARNFYSVGWTGAMMVRNPQPEPDGTWSCQLEVPPRACPPA